MVHLAAQRVTRATRDNTDIQDDQAKRVTMVHLASGVTRAIMEDHQDQLERKAHQDLLAPQAVKAIGVSMDYQDDQDYQAKRANMVHLA